MGILSFWAHRSRKRALRLYDEAWERLSAHAYHDALAIARKLRKLRFSGAYEIEGRAYMALEQHDDAVRVLSEGVKIAPSVWINWLLLGSSLSNVGRYDDALHAYDRAASCERADVDNIEVNRAVVKMRQHDQSAALDHLDRVAKYESESARLYAVALRVTCLRELGREAEAEELGGRTLREWRNNDVENGKEAIGEIARELGTIRHARGENVMLLRAQAMDWWRATHNDRLLWLIRELRPVRSPRARFYRLLVCARIPSGGGFFKNIDAVADSPEEALALYIELDPPDEGVELEIEEAKVLEERPDDVKGVYSAAMGRIYFPD